MSRPSRAEDSRRRGSFGSLAIFLFGVPLGVGLLMLIGEEGPISDPQVIRYTSHPVEMAELILFCCGLCALLGKFLNAQRERAACGRDLLPAWDGKPLPTGDATRLQQHLALQSGWLRHTYLGRRLTAALDFVANRGTVAQLDDQLRSLADADANALDGTYGLLRFINWAIPILGFLGTVLGITEAIAGVTPEMLEKSLSSVTDGLATAFDTTALALLLTMILMFGSFLAERLEQGLLETVDQLTEAELAHRFARAEEGNPVLAALQQNTQVLLAATQKLVETQVNVWAQTMQKAEARWTEAGNQQQTHLAATLQQALEFALVRYGQRLAELEDGLLVRHQAVLDTTTQLAGSLRDSGREHQLALARLTDNIGLQVEMLGNMQASEQQLMRLQETLSQNLALLASSDTFEQAVQSLTAAIHLLTTRVGQNSAPMAPRLHHRPEAA